MEQLCIVDLFQEPRQSIHDVLEGLVVVLIHLFTFYRFDEALALSVVVRISTPAYRAVQAPRGHQPKPCWEVDSAMRETNFLYRGECGRQIVELVRSGREIL